MGRREFSPPGMFSNIRPSFHKFDAVGVLPPHGGFHPHDDRPPFMQNFHRPGIPPHISDRMPSSAPWGSQVGICLQLILAFEFLVTIKMGVG